MLRMTPPSARTAEPLIEVACALATNATTAATSSGVSKRFKSEEGRTAEKNCFSISAFEKVTDAFGSSGTGENGIHGDSGTGNGFRQTASDSHLRRLGHAVVDHFRGNVLCGFAGDENDAAPVFLQHAGKIAARKANAAQDVHFEKAEPVGIGNLEKWFGFKDSEIVDQDVRVRHLLEEFLNAVGGTQVRGNASKVGFLDARPDLFDGGVDARFRASVDDDLGALRGKRCSDGEANTGG